MTMVVGYAPDGRSRAVLHLAAMLARSADEDLLLCAVVPAAWPPSPARVDAEYRAYLERVAQDALASARVPADVSSRTLVHHARSAPAGLLEVAEERDAVLIVVGSETGSTSTRLLHSSPIPVAMAPRGFRARPDARVTRATAAYGGSEGADELVVAAAGVAARVGASLRLASFAVVARPPYTSGVGREAQGSLIGEWTSDIEAAARAALEEVEHLPAVPPALDTVIGYGETWEEALDDVEWEDGDVLVVGSSAVGPVAQVFVGSRATKIVRHSPVPVIVVPRGRAAELASRAAAAAQAP
jgi:nucleotide-binding universal stress UspA family protein